MKRLDLYTECNVDGSPVDVFTAECCMACINPQCTRSSFGKSKFDVRVSSWYDRLFAQVPRLDPGDARFQEIAAQKFQAIQPALSANVWLDPIEPVAASPAPTPVVAKPVEAPTPLPAPAEPPPAPVALPVAVEEAPVPVKPEPAPSTRMPPHMVTANTPLKQGQMLPGAPTPQPPSWDAPTPPQTDGVQIVKPGAKVKLGGS